MDPAPDWDAHQSSIQDLYWNEGKELPEVMRIMEEKYQFVATRKQYKKQLKAWGYEKNIKAHEMKAMLQIQRRRMEEEGKETRFIRRGREVPMGKLTRFRKRYKITERNATQIIPCERAATPDDIVYETPEPEPLHSPYSAPSNQSGEPSDDVSLDVEGDSVMLPAPGSEQTALYNPHSPVVPRTEQAWLNVNNPFNYASVSPAMGAEFSGVTIKSTPQPPSGFHTHTRNSFPGTLSPSAFLTQTSDAASFGPDSAVTHNLSETGGSWTFDYFPQDIRPTVPASSREPSDALGEQYYEYPAGPPTQANVSWTNGCASGQPMSSKQRDIPNRQESTVADESGRAPSRHSPAYPPGGESRAAAVSSHAAGGYNATQGALAAFRNCSPLHRAVIRGDVERARALLKRNDTDPNTAAFGGITPLHCAAFQRNTRLVDLLREYGAKLDATTNHDQSILFFAVCNPDRLKGGERGANCLKALRELPVRRTDDNTVDIINALFDCPVGWAPLLRIVDKPDTEGITPLMAAAEGGFIRTATLLLQRGARPEKKDKASYTALKYAATCNRPQLVRLLLEADTRIQDRDLSHMLKLVTRTLPSVRPDTDRRAASSRSYQARPRDSSYCEGSAVVLEEMARVYRDMGVLEKLIGLAEQQEQPPKVVEYLANAHKSRGKFPR